MGLRTMNSLIGITAVAGCLVVSGPGAWWVAEAADTPAEPPATTTTTLAGGSQAPPSPEAEKAAKAAKEACGVVDAVGSGDLSGLASLTPAQEASLGRQMPEYVSCLAVARNDKTYCDRLPKAGKSYCASQVQAVEKLKALPKGQSPAPILAPVLNQMCKNAGLTKQACDQLQDAVATNNAGKCSGLPERVSAFCGAIVSGDAKRCKDDDSCTETVKTLTKVKNEGLSGFSGDGGPATFAAAQKGESACAPLLAEMKTGCKAQK